MSFDANRLYNLLPAFYRIRDAELAEQLGEAAGEERQGPLKALLTVIAEQAAVLEEDLDQLYDDQFIETCAQWVVPYIGDLVGARRVFVFPGARFTERSFVANTMAYRRRKGTAAMLEQLARDVTGWNANVVEYFLRLATTQYMNHIRLDNHSFPTVRYSEPLEFVSTPFDPLAHTVDVRRIASRRGKYNIPNIGIFLWRLNNYSITNAPAFRVDDRRYLFDALGKDIPLYNKPETEDEITHLAEPINVPMPITRRVLDRDLEKYYGVQEEDQVRSILINVNGDSVLPGPDTGSSPPPPKLSDLIQVCDLSDVVDSSGNILGWAHQPQDRISIDPVLGRLAFPENQPPPERVRVTYNYGFSTEMGGGEYSRGATFSKLERKISVPSDQPTIQAALTALQFEFSGSPELDGGVIEIERPETAADSDYYDLNGPINVPAAKVIEIRAADQHRPVIRLTGELVISGEGASQLLLNGLVLTGATLRVPDTSELRLIRFSHCTMPPGPGIQTTSPPSSPPSDPIPALPSLLVESPDVTVELISTICGAIGAVDGAHVSIHNSIVDSGDETFVAYSDADALSGSSPPGPTPFGEPGAPLQVVNSTIIGKVNTLTMELASNTIFFADRELNDLWPAPVYAERLQAGCVRFSYVPPESRLPRLYRCQPATVEDAARVRPVFTSLRYGDAGYCQLSQICAEEIRQGADDQAEMGAFHDLYQPQREANLSASLSEYLRFGLEAGIFLAS
jgi:hypothetical protein